MAACLVFFLIPRNKKTFLVCQGVFIYSWERGFKGRAPFSGGGETGDGSMIGEISGRAQALYIYIN